MSEIRVTTVSNTAGTGPATLTSQWAAKSWVRYNQITNTIGDSENVSSITDTSAGVWVVNFTNNMANANYSIVKSAHASGFIAQANNCPDGDDPPTTSDYGCHSGNTITGALTDLDLLSDAVFGDLA